MLQHTMEMTVAQATSLMSAHPKMLHSTYDRDEILLGIHLFPYI